MNDEIANLILTSEILVGKRQVERGMSEANIRCVIVALDADEALKSQITERAAFYGVPLKESGFKSELGKLAGIEVNAAVIGILK